MRLLWIAIALASIGSLDACTGMMLRADDGASITGRTLEFGTPVQITPVVIPRGFSFTGTTQRGKGIAYSAKYGAVGMVAFGVPAILDGINEKGLSVGVFYFPSYAEYTPLTKDNQSRALSPIEFTNWIITQFATVQEVKAALSQVVIVPTVGEGWGNTPPPFHYIVYDQQGNCLVVEPIEGKLVARDNPLGVYTNSPTFDWHMTNLRNFINLRTENAAPLQMADLTFAPFGQGSGMVGLPGDFTPPSRFVRAAFFSQNSIPSKNADQAVLRLFHLLNQFDIPYGICREGAGDNVTYDYTQVTCARDAKNLKYYFKTYEDPIVQMVDLTQFDLDAKTIKKVKTY